MRTSKALPLVCTFACMALHALAQNVNVGQTTNARETASGNRMLAALIDDQAINTREIVGTNQSLVAVISRPTSGNRETAGDNQTLATYIVGSITKPSPGQFKYFSTQSWQTNGTGWGRSAEYRRKIWRRNYGGLLFSDTPTNATIYTKGQKPFTWPIRRYEFDVLWTHEFAPVRHRLVPYVTSGPGAIALNGGPTESGWNGQAALVAGAGSDVRLARFLTLRAGFTADWFKASTYSDQAYCSKSTIMVEPRIGLVWALGMPHPH